MATPEAASKSSVIEEGARPGLILAAVAVVQLMVSLDLSVVNVGLPKIATGLGFDQLGLTWVIHAYALTFGGLLLLGGKLADRFGRKKILVVGLGLFFLASLGGGFAQQPGQLIAARAAQGTGAALLAPAALAQLTATFPSGKARVKAFGVWAAMSAAGGAFGVLIGGVLTQYAGWQWVMFISAPMSAIALLLAWLGIAHNRPDAPSGRPDIVGAVLATGGMMLLVYGVVRTDHYGWSSARTLTTLAIAVVLLAAFIVNERITGRDPLIRLGLFTNRSVAGANSFNLLLGAAMASSFFFVSLYLQRVLGHAPAMTGVLILPFALGVGVGTVTAVKLGYRVPAQILLTVGGLLCAVGFFWFSGMNAHGSFLSDILGPEIVTSIGFGLSLGPVSSIATAGVASSETGTASGLLNASRQIGASFGLAALGTAAQHRAGNGGSLEAVNSGYGFGMALGAALMAAAAFIALIVVPRKAGATSEDKDEPTVVAESPGLSVAE